MKNPIFLTLEVVVCGRRRTLNLLIFELGDAELKNGL